MVSRFGLWCASGFFVLACVGCGPKGLYSTHSVERTHRVRVTSEPPGALVWQVDEQGRRKIGVAPVEFQRSYVDKLEKDWNDSFGLTVAGLIVGGVGVGILAGTSYEFSSDVGPLLGYSFVAASGLSILLGLGWFIADVVMDPDDADDDPVEYKLEATKDGFEATSASFSLGFKASAPRPEPLAVQIDLVERWWERYGMKSPADKLSAAAVPLLRRALRDKKDVVRREAALALAEIGRPAKDAIAELILLLGDGDSEIRAAAISALEAIELPDPRVIESLKRAFEYDSDPMAREAARKALQKLSLLRIAVTEPEAKVPVKEPTVAVEIVAVTDVFDASGKFKEDTLVQLTTYLGTALTRSGKYQLIPRDRLRAGLAEQKKESYRECMDESCQIELGRAVSATKLLSTQLLQVGSKCAVTANLYDLKSETTQKGAMVQTGCSPDELLDAMQQIADQL